MPSLTRRIAALTDRLAHCESWRRIGRLEGVSGSSLLATLPAGRVGELVTIGPQGRVAEVTGFRESRVVLTALGDRKSLRAGMEVVAEGRPVTIGFSRHLLGRVLDPAGRALDGRGRPRTELELELYAPAPAAMQRRPIRDLLPTGVRSIDGLVSLGHGQRIGLFAGAGLGKSSLLAQIARGAEVDCSVVCLVGERGREVQEFVEQGLGERGLKSAVVICATSDAPVGLRARALPAATAIAEGFRRQGKRVLLLVDSLTRCARALREISLSAGEPPMRRGFPASVFDRLARLVERTGNDQFGSISAIYTVLTEDLSDEDPLAEEVRGLLDGHLVLQPALARSGCFPAVDPVRSLSRLMGALVTDSHREAAREFRRLWTAYEERRDFIAAGAYVPGSEPAVDLARRCRPEMLRWMRQTTAERSQLQATLAGLLAATSPQAR
jgi:FliI/YscN family ATPase